MISRIPDVTPSSNKTKEKWHYYSRRLICDWCGVNCDLYMLGKEIICADCVENMDEVLSSRGFSNTGEKNE